MVRVGLLFGPVPGHPGFGRPRVASPLFPSVTVTLPDGHRLVEQAPGAAASRPYVHALRTSGITRPSPKPAGCAASAAVHSPTGAWGPALATRLGAPDRRHPHL